MAIDTLGYAKALKAAGVPAAQAEAHAEALRDTVVPELASKQDLKDETATLRSDFAAMRSELKSDITDVRTELKSEIAEVRTDIWRVALASVLATTTLVTFAQKLFH